MFICTTSAAFSILYVYVPSTTTLVTTSIGLLCAAQTLMALSVTLKHVALLGGEASRERTPAPVVASEGETEQPSSPSLVPTPDNGVVRG